MLDGGSGRDYLEGGSGNDTYIFGKGYGQDSLSDYDTTVGNVDTLRILEGVNPSEVVLKRNNSNLELVITGTSDKLVITNYFANDYYKVEQIQFDDGTIWDTATIRDQVNHVSGNNENDVIQGYEDNEVIAGLSGNDVIYGNGGNDTETGSFGDDKLYGGSGNDYLEGNSGNDTYVFGRGDGRDTIKEVYL